jgi:hypothetical protein
VTTFTTSIRPIQAGRGRQRAASAVSGIGKDMRSMTIRHHKRQARLRAAANGTTHQAELNAIAREHGHVSWGGLQAALSSNRFDKDALLRREVDERLLELVDAYDAARGAGGHLVVLRADRDEEASAILSLRHALDDEAHRDRLVGIAFAERLTLEAIAGAASRSQTLVASSDGMARTTSHGQFIAYDPDDVLTAGGSLVSRRDQETIYATTDVRYVLPRNREEAERMLRGDIGSTTIVRTTASRRRIVGDTAFDSVDDGMAISLDWNLSDDRRDEDWRRLGFIPSFNVLGPKFLPDAGDARDAHVQRIVDILLPDGTYPGSIQRGRLYFEEKARHLLYGMIHLEIGRAEREGRTPTIPALMDWLLGGIRSSNRLDDERGSPSGGHGHPPREDAVGGWFRELVVECMEHGYHEACATELLPMVSMASNERTGILGTMDRGLLPFKSGRVREMNS